MERFVTCCDVHVGVTIQVPIILLRYEVTADNEVQQSNKFVSKITIIIATRGDLNTINSLFLIPGID